MSILRLSKLQLFGRGCSGSSATASLCLRYRALLRDEIAQTLDDPARVAEELCSLQAALAV